MDSYSEKEITNANLLYSKAGKQDEFYTQITTIEDELSRYPKAVFEGKVVLCNCDNPEESNFWKYFQKNFFTLKLKKLISTHYEKTGISYSLEMTEAGIERKELEGNGDFQSEECKRFLKEADLVITNPPYSLMNIFLPCLIEHGKQFIILGNINHITLKEIKKNILEEKVWLGYNTGHFWFRVPDQYEEKKTDFKIDENGYKWRRMGNCCWFTNVDISRIHQKLIMSESYYEKEYEKYDTIDAIEIPSVKEIPGDYWGVMGVSITYISKHNPEQFKILDIVTPKINGKSKYKRILIQRRNDTQ